ncbi:MAG: methyltransferase [Phycisphaerales bacterium]|nr:methyltransferase [Ilumatobacter sp.]NNM25864.1 methyltransferase [Phycisphaerales bacterium]
MTDDGEAERLLYEALGASQRLGFVGGRSISEVIEHARVFVDALSAVSGAVLDLGSGGGVPGLVIAVDRPDLAVTLLDRRTKRTDFLSRMIRRMGLTDRVTVLAADVDDAIRAGLTGFDGVVARGFGPPAATLRTALDLVAPAGTVVISEPPSGDRWDPALLVELGVSRLPSDPRVAVFRRVS